ncbi:MAG: hypothetical protein ABIP06_10395 [Pyrinomonadaceae bacterium]
MKRILLQTFFCLFLVSGIFAQTETLTNQDVILMTQAGLGKDLIIKKIKNTIGNYNISAQNLIDLKKAGVDDEVLKLIMEKAEAAPFITAIPPVANETQVIIKPGIFSINSQNFTKTPPIERIVLNPKEALKNAKTIAIDKSSLFPPRQELEKALLKRKDWKTFNLNIVRLKEDADLYIEIGHIPLTLISWRYVFRIYDRRSGTVLTAGETTAWGNLADNLAKKIVHKLNTVSAN